MTQSMLNLTTFGRRPSRLQQGRRRREELDEMEIEGLANTLRPGITKIKGKRIFGRERRVPYSKLERRTRGVVAAPGNTTQFLMKDQQFSDSDLEQASSESEDDFVRKEFAKEYASATPIRQKMQKSKLIEEYLNVEKSVKILETKLEEARRSEDEDKLETRLGAANYHSKISPEIVEKIRIFQEELLLLSQENRTLRIENNLLITENRAAAKQPSSSSDSSSSSEQSSDSDSDSSSSEDEQADENIEESTRESAIYKDSDSESKRDDTGYESDRSAVSSTFLI